jgi:hypothetical protein
VTVRLGISIRQDECAAVVVRRGRVRWRGRVARDPREGARRALAELLAGAPKRRSGVRVVVAVGAAYVQIRQIGGVPPTLRAGIAARLVQENVASFFLRSPGRLVVTSVQRNADGTVWSAALDGTLVDETIDALRIARFASAAFVPEPVAAALVLAPGLHRVVDGDVAAEFVSANAKTLQRFRRARGDAIADTAETLEDLPPAIRSLGEDARHYIAAFGAASCSPNHPLAWRRPVDPGRVRSMARLRLGISAALLVLSIVAALLAPGVRAWTDARRSMRLADRREVVRAAAARVERDLRLVTGSLDRVERFVSKRDDVPLVLAELARALPESTALLGLRIDSLEVSLSILSPHAADVISELSHAERVASPGIRGSVMREAGKREALERATIHLRRRNSVPRR